MRNIFDQTICDPTCPAWSEEHQLCDAQLSYTGRTGVVDGRLSFGILCRISDKYKLVKQDD